jgi:glyoxylase-like metal-dependent hydrolase (beta-lactamase superfamily II)
VDSWPCTTAAGATRRRCGSRSSALVFADALTAPEGDLRVWASPSHEARALPALSALLELPFDHVIVSHGEPAHDRAAYERALELPPWEG